jgi:hypothetical protein
MGVQMAFNESRSLLSCGFRGIIRALSFRPEHHLKAAKDHHLAAFFIGKSMFYSTGNDKDRY